MLFEFIEDWELVLSVLTVQLNELPKPAQTYSEERSFRGVKNSFERGQMSGEVKNRPYIGVLLSRYPLAVWI
jgi:hypothetical protein